MFSRKTSESISVESNYAFSFKSGIGINNNIVVMNLDGITHSDGTPVQYFKNTMRNNILKYTYISASILSTKCTYNNGQVFLGDTNLSQVEFAPGSKITELGPSAFKQCAITEIVLPEGLTYIDERAFDACANLKKIYIPRTVTFVDEIAFRGVTDAEYYFTGFEEITIGWEITDKIQYVNHCDVYYGGEHICEDDGDCTTALECERCLAVIEAASDIHDNRIVVEYTNGFMFAGIKKDGCIKCSKNETEILAPLFTCLGYSAPEDGRGGIAIGYTVNNEAIVEYETITGKTLKYGVFAVMKDKLGTNDVFAEDGTVAEGVINADITSYEFALFELKIIGFTDEYKDLKLAMGAYVAVTDGETTEYSYMQSGSPNENEKYCFVSYNDIVPTTSNED